MLPASARRKIKQQATGLREATVTVDRAYYFHEPRWFTPKNGKPVLAVEATFRNTQSGFDLDDVTLEDGQHEKSLADPIDWDIIREENNVSTDGKLPTASFRLFYMLSEPLSSLRLSYWQQRLTRDPFPVEPDSTE